MNLEKVNEKKKILPGQSVFYNEIQESLCPNRVLLHCIDHLRRAEMLKGLWVGRFQIL